MASFLLSATTTVQIIGRAVIMAALIGSVGAVAIPRAFSIMAGLEMIGLGMVLAYKLQRRVRAEPAPA